MSRFYLRVLSFCYSLAGLLHGLDILDLRLQFSRMSLLAQSWTVYTIVCDLMAAAALWRASRLGDLIFILVVIAQLAVFVAWSPFLPNQQFIVVFHAICLTVFLILMSVI